MPNIIAVSRPPAHPGTHPHPHPRPWSHPSPGPRFLARRRLTRALAGTLALLLAAVPAHADTWVGFDFGSAPFTLGQAIPFWATPNVNPPDTPAGSSPWQGYFTSGGGYGFDISPCGPAPGGDWLVTSSAAFGRYELLLGHNVGPWPYERVGGIRFS